MSRELLATFDLYRRCRGTAATTWVMLSTAALLSGCVHPAPLAAPIDDAPARALVATYLRSCPVRLQAVQSVVMTWRHRPMTALGWLRYDREEGTFALAGMSPTGATLFSLRETGGKASGTFSALPGGDPNAWVQAMAQDIRRIYFEAVPTLEDEARLTPTGVVVTRRLADGNLLRLTLDTNLDRTQAEWFAGRRRLGTTVSEDFETVGTMRVPRRIVHRNHVYGYELRIRTQEIQPFEPLPPAHGETASQP